MSEEKNTTAGNEPDKTGAEQKEFPIPSPVITRHQYLAGGAPFAYTATTGYMKMNDEQEKHKANIFYVAYTKNEARADDRAITFAFNGGPGSSAVWLHCGALGPRRVLFGDQGEPMAPPYRMTDNKFSWLDFTDLVFIDPVGTGYSRAAKDEKTEQFQGVREDVNSVGEFIRRYVTENRRWLSPKFLAGESYGATRAAGLSGHLHEQGMFLNGVALISSILQFQTVQHAPGNDLPFILHLPTYTATAWYHKRLSKRYQADLRKTLQEVRHWAMNDYLLALGRGSALGHGEREKIARRLADYTGLTKEYILGTNLRIEIMRFAKELLRPLRRTAGRLDTRYTGADRDAVGENFEYDPSYDAVILGPFTVAVNNYLHAELGYQSELPYETLNIKAHIAWNWGTADKGYTNVSEELRQSMTKNPALKIFVANGYYDLATPFFATEYTMNHLGLEGESLDNVSMEYYDAGHMMYIHRESLEKFTRDIRASYRRALPSDGEK